MLGAMNVFVLLLLTIQSEMVVPVQRALVVENLRGATAAGTAPY